MFDFDLAALHGVSTKALNQGVKRNRERFPEDFMFQLNIKEAALMRSQFATASKRNKRYRPNVFTEHGALMLASVLSSSRAIEASIQVVRVFVALRQFLSTHKELARKLQELEEKCEVQFKFVFETIKKLRQPPEMPRRKIGFSISPP